jgi:glycerol-3-phosphate dehydrogenase
LKPITTHAWLKTLADYDILIIGGGIYGCGIAQALAASGYRVRLLEKNNLASGTSSQSTKLIHGGLRYLEQGNLKLVYEALAERERLLRLAPDLVRREWFYIPIYQNSKRPAWVVRSGLLLYWLLSGGRSRFKCIPELSWDDVAPGLRREGLKTLLAYEDAATDDAALTCAVAVSARHFGCEISEQVALKRAKRDGSVWHAQLTGEECVTSRILINAAGPWVNRVCARIKPTPAQLPVRLVQGSHLILDRICPGYIYTESLDGRVMFFRPWQENMLAGTTETSFAGDPDRIKPTSEEIEDILATYNHYFPDATCNKADILGTYCGLRVLPESDGEAFSANRETVIHCDDPQQPAYIALYGGKLTTYRKKAEQVLHLVGKAIKPPHQADTTKISLCS